MPDSETTSAQPTAPASPDFSALLQNGKIFGKYNTPEEAARGFWELNNYAADQARANRDRELRERATATPPQSALSRAADEALVKPDIFAAAIEEVAQRVVNARFAPLEHSLGARAQLSTEIPEFAKNEPAVQAWLNTNPQINQLVTSLQASGTPEGALAGMRLAYREWQASQIGRSAPTPAEVAAASVPGATGSGSPNGAAQRSAEDDMKALTDAVAWARQTGDRRPVYSELFKDFKFYPGSEDFINQ